MKLQLRQKCSDCGQTITEYVLMLGLTLGVLVISVLFLGVFQEWAWRILQLIGMEYP
jgi:hypothetical protein